MSLQRAILYQWLLGYQLLGTCAAPTAPPACGWRYTAFRWDSLAPTTWRLVVTDSVWVCNA